MRENNSKLERFFGSVYVNIVVALVVIVKFFQHGLTNCFVMNKDWQACELTLNYSYGFVKRAFLGTIVKFFAVDMGAGYEKTIITLMNLEELLFTIIFIGFVFFVINKFKDARINIIVILLFSTNILGLYYNEWGEPDLVLMALTIISCLLIVKDKFVWAVPVISALCVLIHEGYVMMYFGLVAALLLVRCIQRKDIRHLLLLGFTVVLAGALSVYLYAFSKDVINVTPLELSAAAQAIFGEEPWGVYLISYVIWNVNGWLWTDGVPNEFFFARITSLLTAVVFCIPIIACKIRFWSLVIKSEPDKLRKFGYVICSLVFLCTTPLFVVHTDWGRWFYCVLFSELLLVVFLYMMDDELIKKALTKVLKISIVNVIIIVALFFIFSRPNKEFIDDLCGIPYFLITGEFPFY